MFLGWCQQFTTKTRQSYLSWFFCLLVFRMLCHYLGCCLMIINSEKCPYKWRLQIFLSWYKLWRWTARFSSHAWDSFPWCAFCNAMNTWTVHENSQKWTDSSRFCKRNFTFNFLILFVATQEFWNISQVKYNSCCNNIMVYMKWEWVH